MKALLRQPGVIVTFAVVGVCGLVFFRCSNSSGPQDKPLPVVSIRGTVTDYRTDYPLSNVTVTLNEDTTLTDESGRYLFENDRIADFYYMTLALPAYATMNCSPHVLHPDSLRDPDFPPSGDLPIVVEREFQMYSLTGTVSGTVLGAALHYPFNDSILVPPWPGLWPRVGLIFETESHLGQEGIVLERHEYWTRANFDGNFNFVNVPLTDSAELVTAPFARGDSSYNGASQTVPIPSEGLEIIPEIDTSLLTSYSYTAYDSLFSPVVQGSLTISHFDSNSFTGTRQFQWVGDASRSLHSAGWGVLRGTRDENRILINLDPDMFDNNTFLRGVVTGNIISGVWEYAGFPGVMDHGTFVAEKEP